jgi:hypothetical protein
MTQMSVARCLAVAIALIFVMPSGARADVVDFRSIIAATPSASILMGEQLEQSRARSYPFYLTFEAPNTSGDVTVAAMFPEDGWLAEFFYHVGGQQLLEYGTLSFATVDMLPPEERMQAIFNVIETQVYPTVGAPADANILGGRLVTVGPYEAIEFISIFNSEQLGLSSARIVAVVPPAGPHVLIVIQQTALSRLGVGDVNELPETFIGRILSSVRFVAARDEAGALIQF